MKGRFIVLEGIDGAGKSIQCRKLAGYLFEKSKENKIFLTREPTHSRYGNKIRKMLKEETNPKENAEIYLDLFLKDRKHHLKNYIMPLLKKGCIIMSDRYKYSTITYQQAQGLDFNLIVDKHENLLVPDLVIIIDVPVDIVFERIKKIRKMEKFENKEFMERLRKNYLDLKDRLKENIVIIDGNKPVEEVFKDIKVEVDKLFNN